MGPTRPFDHSRCRNACIKIVLSHTAKEPKPCDPAADEHYEIRINGAAMFNA
jgi:hypothetical protein